MQYQIKGKRIGRESNWGKTITVGKYFELKVVYKQQHRKPVEDKLKYKQNHRLQHHYDEPQLG
eukprot:3253632-Amphidinium_carterae.1